jgi:hypothetical protein
MATAPATSNLQQRINAASPNSELTLALNEEVHAPTPLVIKKPIKLNGNGGSLWAERGPVLEIRSENVALRNLNVEVTVEGNVGPLSNCAIEVKKPAGLRLENVRVRGDIVGVPDQEGDWEYPLQLELGNLPAGIELERYIDIAVPVACALTSNVAGVDVEPSSLTAGRHRIRIRIGALQAGVRVNGWLVLAAGGVERRIVVSGNVVSGPKPPIVVQFTAQPATIAPGESTILGWMVNDAAEVSISGLGDVAAADSRQLTPPQSTMYTLQAKGAGGTATANAAVTVRRAPPPTPMISHFTISPATIQPGGTAHLSWDVRNATDVAISGVVGLLPPSGTRDVQPAMTTTYILAVQGPGGKTSSSATVAVRGGAPPITKVQIKRQPRTRPAVDPSLVSAIAAIILLGITWWLSVPIWSTLLCAAAALFAARKSGFPRVAGLGVLPLLAVVFFMRPSGLEFKNSRPLDTGGVAISALATSADGTLVAGAAADGAVRLWDGRTGASMGAPLKRYEDRVLAVAIAPGGKSLASGRADSFIVLWDAVTHDYSNTLRGHQGPVNVVAYRDENTLISGGDDTRVLVWNTQKTSPERTLGRHDGPVRAIAVSPDRKTIVTGAEDGHIIAWDFEAGSARWTSQQDGAILAVAVSADGKLAASGGKDGVIRFWDIASGAAKQTLSGDGSAITSLALTSRGLVAGSANGKVMVWDPGSESAKQTLDAGSGLTVLSLSPNGGTMASAAGATAKLWSN